MGQKSSNAGGGGGKPVVQQQQTQPQVQPQPLPTPSVAQVKKGNVLPKGGIPYDQFEKMTDDQKADVIEKAMAGGVPMFLEDSGMQRFAYFTGMNTKPTVVSDAQLDKTNGTEMYRTINNVYNSKMDMGYKSTDIANQIAYGDFTMYSDSGGSAYGKGIYFAEGYSSSASYGKSGQNPVTMRAKVTGKTIKESSLDSAYRKAQGTKLYKAVQKAPGTSDDKRNLWALAKGYDAIDTGSYSRYWVVLNRRGITLSSTFKPTDKSRRTW